MTAKDAVVIADAVSALGTEETALLIARWTDIISDMSRVLKIGVDIGQRTSGKRKEVSNETEGKTESSAEIRQGDA